MRIILSLLLICFFTASAFAQEEEKFIFPSTPDFAALSMTGTAQADGVIDPLRVRLQDGRIVQLEGIDIPDLTPYESGGFGLTALEMLKTALARNSVKIYQSKDSKERTNRMGYHLAHLAEKNSGLWLQGALLANGLARVRPSEQAGAMAQEMMALELEAREAKRGLWKDEQYAVLSPETAGQALNGWAIIEGTVRANAMAGNTVYLNFGNEWREDFTVGIKPSVRRELTKLDINPLGYANKRVRVRGWVEEYNGPYIELLHPVWIEILPESAGKDTLPLENN